MSRITKEFSREQLMAMPLVAIKRLDIDTPSQQELVQEIVNIKLADLPVQRPVYRKDIPDIQTPEQEMQWQEIIKQREAKIRGVKMEESPVEIPSSEPVLEPTPPIDVPGDLATPVVPAAPVPGDINEAGMAQATGEGAPVTMSLGVSPKLASKTKKTKAK